MNTAQLQHSLRNIPTGTRLLALSIIIISSLGYILSLTSTSNDDVDVSTGRKLIPLLAMIPGSSIYCVWTFFTAGLLETSIIPFFINSFGFVMMGRYMEHAWGMKEFIKFIGIVNLSAHIGAFFMALIEYAGTLDPIYFYETQVCGLGGILCGFVIAFKQTVPEHTITVFKFFSFRVKHLPSLVIIGHLVLVLLRLEGNLQFWVALYASLAAWVYIRFYKMQDGIRGDRSETFALSSFFPEALHIIIKPISNSTFNLLVKLKVCPPLLGTASGGYTDLESGKSRASISGSSATAEAERRRAIALKALDERAAVRAQNGIPPILPTSKPGASSSSFNSGSVPSSPLSKPTFSDSGEGTSDMNVAK